MLCGQAGTHLVDGGEIHGGSKGRSAQGFAESGSAGGRLRPRRPRPDFISAGVGAERFVGRVGVGRRGALPGHTPPGLPASRPAPCWWGWPRPGQARLSPPFPSSLLPAFLHTPNGPRGGRDPAGHVWAFGGKGVSVHFQGGRKKKGTGTEVGVGPLGELTGAEAKRTCTLL